jgi:hypothetical protein
MSCNTGLKNRMRKFFDDNPDEELTKSDMAVKFDATEAQIDDAIGALKAEGAVVRTIVYRAAPVDNLGGFRIPSARGMRVGQ